MRAAKEGKMTKQILKGIGAASLVAALAVLSVPAEAATIRCNIPFSFTVNDKTLPAGTYTVSTETAQGVLFVRGFGHAAVVSSIGLESGSDTSAKLVFHKYGDQYVLRQAWMGSGPVRQLPASRLERTIARAAQDGRVAADFQRVVVPVL